MAGIKLCQFCGERVQHDAVNREWTCPKGCGSNTDYVLKALREKKARQEQAKRAAR